MKVIHKFVKSQICKIKDIAFKLWNINISQCSLLVIILAAQTKTFEDLLDEKLQAEVVM